MLYSKKEQALSRLLSNPLQNPLQNPLILIFAKEKTGRIRFVYIMAGAEGIEPSSKVLETSVLPLNHAPTARIQASVIITPTKRGYKKEE